MLNCWCITWPVGFKRLTEPELFNRQRSSCRYNDQFHKPCIFTLPPLCQRDLLSLSFGILHSVEWHFITDVWGQLIGPIFKDQAVQIKCWEHPGTQSVKCIYTLLILTCQTATCLFAKGFILKHTIRIHLYIPGILNMLHFISLRTGIILKWYKFLCVGGETRINLLKTKRNLLYVRNQFVPRSKHFPPRL